MSSATSKGYCEEVSRLVSLPENNKKKRSSAVAPLCRFYVMNRGSCRHGDNCAFSHKIPAEMSWDEAKKLVPCPFFAKGTCKYGDYCKLNHDPQVFAEKAPAPAVEESSKTCGICLDDIDSTSNRKFGLLSCCGHAFCHPCLMAWRKEGSPDACDRRSCPTCRKHSDYVVPSEHFPADAKEKEEIVQAYKDKLSVIPCRRFSATRELGSCPFGSDCFYAHLNSGGEDVKDQDKTMAQLREEKQEQQRERMARTRREITGDIIAEYMIAMDFEQRADLGMEAMVMDFLRLVDVYGFDGARAIFMSDDEEEEEEEDFDEDYEDVAEASPGINFYRHMSEVIAMEQFMFRRYDDDEDEYDEDDIEDEDDDEDFSDDDSEILNVD
mmetsp:Transcript_64064/g.184118  ORF Transcript_64064/g.184118 Transcript_64064/m.184118 type:complete len:381 (-) Transcript_64064:107-1249(-)